MHLARWQVDPSFDACHSRTATPLRVDWDRVVAGSSTIGKGSSAFTLLEVILALAILAGAVAVLGEIMSVAGRHTREAQAETRAQLLAASVMDEMLTGLAQVAPVSRQPLETTDTVPWIYSVNVNTTTITGLSLVEVLVEQDLESQFNPVRYRLVRFYAAPLTTTPATATTGAGGANG